MTDGNPTLLIFAGANGAGKSTLAESLIPKQTFKDFLNADDIARGLSPFDPASQRVEAGKILLSRMHDLIEQRKDFAIETTLSGKTLVRLLKQAKALGYDIRLFYVHVSDVKINMKRIKNRVKQGGHHISTDDIKRRYPRSIYNLFHLYYDICDIVAIYDNTNAALELVAVKLRQNVQVVKKQMDIWESMKKLAGLK